MSRRSSLALWVAMAACVSGCGGRSQLVGFDDADAAVDASAADVTSTGHGDAAIDAPTRDAPAGDAASDTADDADAGGDAEAGYPSCGPGDVLVGAACVRQVCAPGDQPLDCLLADGTVGHCVGVTCSSIDFVSDPSNCRYVGKVCPAAGLCVNGLCSIGCVDPADCPAGLTCDPDGSGACDLATCAAGDDYRACHVPFENVATPQAFCCGTTCTALLADSKNCGYCGHVCPGGAQCLLGVCDTDCATAQNNTACQYAYDFCCNGACTEPDVCSTCGTSCVACAGAGSTPCGPGQACTPSGCAPTSCSGSSDGTSCADLDPNGVMKLGDCCGGACTLRSVDPHNCGVCGNACAAGEVCLGGACTTSAGCESKITDLSPLFGKSSPCVLPSGQPGACCDGACVDVETDNANCTGCNRRCPLGATCGVVPSEPSVVACLQDGAQVACQTAPCPDGFGCATFIDSEANNLGLCVPSACAGVADGVTCFLSSASLDDYAQCCGGACVDLRADAGNCGACGAACPAGFHCGLSCFDGSGTPLVCGFNDACPAGTACVTFDGAVDGCYPRSCAGLSNGDACALGSGVTGTCCGGNCAAINEDPSNCGQCGFDCGDQLCLGGKCEATVESGCDPACAAGETCFLGKCLGPVCGEVQTPCFSEVTQPGPVVPCRPPCQPTDICIEGKCAGPVCLDSALCGALDGHLGVCCADGSCADVANDPRNCGGCGVGCGVQPCIDGTCAGASCGYGNQGAFCGGPNDVASICCGASCIDASADPANCGACGNACAAGQTCKDGRCS